MIRRLLGFLATASVGAVLLDRWLGGFRADPSGPPVHMPIRLRVEVAAPIGTVWTILADIERQPRWMTDLRRVRVLGPLPVGPGTWAEGDVHVLGITIRDRVEIVEFSPPHRYGIRHVGLVRGTGLFSLDTLDGGRRTSLEWTELLVAPILPDLASVVVGPLLQRVFRADLDRFVTMVAAEAPRDEAGRDETPAPETRVVVAATSEPPAEPRGYGSNGHVARPVG